MVNGNRCIILCNLLIVVYLTKPQILSKLIHIIITLGVIFSSFIYVIMYEQYIKKSLYLQTTKEKKIVRFIKLVFVYLYSSSQKFLKIKSYKNDKKDLIIILFSSLNCK